MWLDPEELSEWSYWYCQNIKDRPDIRKHITHSKWAYWYCLWINDDPEVRKYIIDSEWAYQYCKDVEDRPEIRKLITYAQRYKEVKRYVDEGVCG